MKKKSLFTTFLIVSALLTLASCQNESWNFPDYEYQSVYFAYQYPVRTIILGEHKFNNELDNNHQFKVMATTAGVYENENRVMVDFEIDESLLDGFQFDGNGDPIQPLPENYYHFTGESDQLVIPSGELAGGITIQLTDAFFQDPDAINNTYVLPMRMTGVANADTILSGVPKGAVSNPRRGVASDWDALPKDFTFYAVKYINRLDGFYLRRGEDVVTGQGGNSTLDTTATRHADYIVKDEVVELNTHSLTEIEFPVTVTDGQGQDRNLTLLLEFDDSGTITVSENASATNYTATGGGTFVHKSESEESWGDESRNAVYLDYEIDHNEIHVETADTLVLRDRGVGMETFTPVLP
ncbi:MAG TPA: DUF5627 domain-containing protein [Fodinibius sp.]|nr:DUF5627 domain-containing protein [Fodinibius sp.]